MDKGLSGLDPYHDGLMDLAALYANWYRDNGRGMIAAFLKFRGMKSVCRAIVARLKSTGEFKELEGDFRAYCERFETDRELLNDILKVIYYLTKN